jgi:hypothetical protein
MNQAEFNSFTNALAEAVSHTLDDWMTSKAYPLPEEMVAALIQIAHNELLYMAGLMPAPDDQAQVNERS